MIEPSVYGGDTALCQITFDHLFVEWLYYFDPSVVCLTQTLLHWHWILFNYVLNLDTFYTAVWFYFINFTIKLLCVK